MASSNANGVADECSHAHAHVNGAFEPERGEQQCDLEAERPEASGSDAASSSASDVRSTKPESQSPAADSLNPNLNLPKDASGSAFDPEARSTRTNSLPTEQLPLRNGLRSHFHAHEPSDTHSSHSDPIGSAKFNGKSLQSGSQLVDSNASLATSQQSMVLFQLFCGSLFPGIALVQYSTVRVYLPHRPTVLTLR